MHLAALSAVLLLLPIKVSSPVAVSEATPVFPDEVFADEVFGEVAVLKLGDVEVHAQAVVSGIGSGVAMPIEFTALRDKKAKRGPKPRSVKDVSLKHVSLKHVSLKHMSAKQVSVKLCRSWACESYQVVELTVGEDGKPGPPVIRRLLMSGGLLVIRELNGDKVISAGAEVGGIRALIGVVGSFSEPIPSAGWQMPTAYARNHVAGGMIPITIGAAMERFPEIVHGYAAVVLAPNASLNDLQLSTLRSYLRAGGQVVVPETLAPHFRPSFKTNVDGEAVLGGKAVLDGKAGLRAEGVPLFRSHLPPLTTFGGQVLRPAQAQRTLPIRALRVETGVLFSYGPAAKPVDIVDALLIAQSEWTRDHYAPSKMDPNAWPATLAATVLLARVPPLGLMILSLFGWGALVLVVVRRARARGAFVALGRVAVLSVVSTVLVLAAGQQMRGEAKTVRVVVVDAQEGASYGYEEGVVMRAVPTDERDVLEVPRGSFALPVFVGQNSSQRNNLRFERRTPSSVELPFSSDGPAGLAWRRPAAVKPTLTLVTDAKSGERSVKNISGRTLAFVAYRDRTTDSWVDGAMPAGATVPLKALLPKYEFDKGNSESLEQSARLRAVQEIGNGCVSQHEEDQSYCLIALSSPSSTGADLLVNVTRSPQAVGLIEPKSAP